MIQCSLTRDAILRHEYIHTRFSDIALRRSCIRTNHISKKLWRPEGKIEELPRTRLRMPCRARLRAFMSSLLRGFGSLRSKPSFCIVVSKSRLEQLLRMQSKFERKWISTSFEYQTKSMSKSIKKHLEIYANSIKNRSVEPSWPKINPNIDFI